MAGNVPSVQEKNIVRIVQSIRDLFEGRSNATGMVRLRANEVTTVVKAPTLGLQGLIFMFPMSATAAAVVTGTYVLPSDIRRGEFTVNHPSDANTDKDFAYVALG